MSFSAEVLNNAHEHAFGNRKEIESSEDCGCFSCLAVFPSRELWDYILTVGNDQETGFCPYCTLDAVIADSSGYPVRESSFLKAMNDKFFGGPPFFDQTIDPHPVTRPGDWKQVSADLWELQRSSTEAKPNAEN